MLTVPAQIFCAPTRAALIAAARFIPGVWAVFGSSWFALMTRTPLWRQSITAGGRCCGSITIALQSLFHRRSTLDETYREPGSLKRRSDSALLTAGSGRLSVDVSLIFSREEAQRTTAPPHRSRAVGVRVRAVLVSRAGASGDCIRAAGCD